MVRLLLTLTMPGALLFADTIVFQTRSVPVWSGALVTGQTAQGTCETVRVGGMGPELQLKPNLVASPADGSCPARIYAFSRLSRPVLVDDVRFTPDPADRIAVTLPPVARVDVKQWILTCRGLRGRPCTGVLDPNNLHTDAVQDVTFAGKVLSDNMLGILVIPKAREDVHRSSAGEQLNAFLGQSPRPDCPTIAAKLQTTGMFQNAVLNVYYASMDEKEPDLSCRPDPESQNPVVRAGFILISAGSPVDVLAHEIGHSMGLGHPRDGARQARDLNNVMEPGSRLNRCRFDLTEAHAVHAKQNFLLHAAPEPDDPSVRPLDATPCGGMANCGTPPPREQEYPCPQAVRKTVLDWVRCLHCPEENIPVIDGTDDDGPYIIQGLEELASGIFRTEDRLRIEEVGWELAREVARRFPALPVEEFAEFYYQALEEKLRLRAVTALSEFERASCRLRMLVERALKRLTSEGDADLFSPRGLTRDTLETAELSLSRLRSKPCETADTPP